MRHRVGSQDQKGMVAEEPVVVYGQGPVWEEASIFYTHYEFWNTINYKIFKKLFYLFYCSTHSNVEDIAQNPREYEVIESATCCEAVAPEDSQTPQVNIPEAIGSTSPSTSRSGIEDPEILSEEGNTEDVAPSKKRPSGGNTSGAKKRQKTDSTTVINAWKQRALEREKLLARINESRDEDGDPTMLFFKSMGALAKTFPPNILCSAKESIFQIMHDLEAALAHDTSASSSGT